MNSKSIIQLLLITIIFVLILLTYKFYFSQDLVKVDTSNIDDQENIIQEMDILEEYSSSNVLTEVEYKSADKQGNNYIVKSKTAKTSNEKSENLILEDVSAVINLTDRDSIYIFSKYALYNSSNLDTKFYGDVSVNFEDNQMKCDNLDLIIKDDFAKMYNNIIFKNGTLNLKADEIFIDIISGNININMFDKNKKIKIERNLSGNNKKI